MNTKNNLSHRRISMNSRQLISEREYRNSLKNQTIKNNNFNNSKNSYSLSNNNFSNPNSKESLQSHQIDYRNKFLLKIMMLEINPRRQLVRIRMLMSMNYYQKIKSCKRCLCQRKKSIIIKFRRSDLKMLDYLSKLNRIDLNLRIKLVIENWQS